VLQPRVNAPTSSRLLRVPARRQPPALLRAGVARPGAAGRLELGPYWTHEPAYVDLMFPAEGGTALAMDTYLKSDTESQASATKKKPRGAKDPRT
jgi:hypothetical protein